MFLLILVRLIFQCPCFPSATFFANARLRCSRTLLIAMILFWHCIIILYCSPRSKANSSLDLFPIVCCCRGTILAGLLRVFSFFFDFDIIGFPYVRLLSFFMYQTAIPSLHKYLIALHLRLGLHSYIKSKRLLQQKYLSLSLVCYTNFHFLFQ